MPIALTAEFLLIARPTDQKIELLAKQFKLTPEQVELCIQTDPSPNQTDFVTWIARQLSKNQLRLPEDGPGTKETLTAFQTQRRRPAFGGNKDINTYATPGDLAEVVQQNAMVVVRNKDVEKFKNMQGVEVVAQKGDLTVFKVDNAEALATLSDSTRWCTRHGGGNGPAGMADNYIRRGSSYVAYYHGAPFAQLHPQSGQFMDKRDKPFVQEYRQETKHPYRRRRRTVGPVVGRAISSPVAQTMVDLLRAKFPDVEQWAKDEDLTDPKELAKLLQGPKDRLDAAVLSGVPLTPQEEGQLFTAEGEEGEPEDFTVWNKLWNYADKFHPEGRWEPLENAIRQNLRKNVGQGIRYAKERMKGRWKGIEPFIIRNAAINDNHAGIALDYAVNVVKGRWRELEDKFWTTKSTDTMPELAYKYAVEVLKQPWRDADPQARFQFGMAKPEVLMCLNTPETAIKYAEHFNIKPWPEFAQILLVSKQLGWYIRYLATLDNKKRDPKLEQRLLSPVPEIERTQTPPTAKEIANYSYYHPGRPCPLRWRRLPSTRTGWRTSMHGRSSAGSARRSSRTSSSGEASDKASRVIPKDFKLLDYGSGYSFSGYGDRILDPFATYLKGVIKGRWPELEQVLLQRYEDYPDIWESNQAFLSGYLNLVRFLTQGKPKEQEENERTNYGWQKKNIPVPSGVWAEGEARLRQRNPEYEARLTQEAVAAMRELETNPKPPVEFDRELNHEHDELKKYIRFLRLVTPGAQVAPMKEEDEDQFGKEEFQGVAHPTPSVSPNEPWPEGVALTRQVENLIEDRRKQVQAQGKYVSSIYNRLASHALLRPRRLTAR